MSKGVVFVGLYRQDWLHRDFKELKAFGDVWSCQDWYARCHRDSMWYPDLVFQIHEKANDPEAFEAAKAEGRYPGNWKKEYNKCKGTFSTVPLDGIRHNIVVPFKTCVEHMGVDYFASTISYMFYWAIRNYYTDIWMLGCKFRCDGEHENQIAGMFLNQMDAEERGINVINPHKEYWLEQVCNKLKSARALPTPYGKERNSCAENVDFDGKKLKVVVK